MNKKYIIGGIIIAGVSVFAYSIYYYIKKQADLLKNFSYKIISLTVDTFTMDLIKGQITILFTSVADVEVTVTEFYLDFYFDGQKVGYLQEVTEFIIPAQGSTQIPLEFTINPSLIITDITDILAYTLKQKDASIVVNGYATLKSGIVKGTLPIQYNTTVSQILS